MPTEPLDQYDDDLPDANPTPVVKPSTPKDPATGKFVSPNPPVEEVKPQHSAYMLSKAREYGVSDAETRTPAELDWLLGHLDRQRTTLSVRQEPAPKPVEQDEPVDWGVGDDGKPLTEADWPKAVARTIRTSHESKLALKKLQAENAELKSGLENDRQERARRQATKQLNSVLATRPDLFGEKPGEAKPGSPEAKRIGLVIAHIKNLFVEKQQTTLEADAKAAMELFGPAAPVPQPKPAPKAGRQTIADYRAAELATPTGRRGNESMSRREQLIHQVESEQRENGIYVPPAGGDDDDDLPD